jgi:DNA-binding XRE family transcriptional regulator
MTKKITYKETESGCWEVTSHKPHNGWYPIICRNGKPQRIHRYQYEQFYGPIPKGKIVRHTCDNPLCINPKHLILGTNQDNVDDRTTRGRGAKGLNNGRAKITDSQVLEIYENDTLTPLELAKKYGISRGTVYQIKKGVRRLDVVGSKKPKRAKRLTQEQMKKIAQSNENYKVIAAEYGVSDNYIHRLRRKYR